MDQLGLGIEGKDINKSWVAFLPDIAVLFVIDISVVLVCICTT
jgi:hypothetical protein